jgi:hypothetical protein
MNERIQELAVQAGLNAPYGSDHEGLRDFDYKKFAELIVQECAGIIESQDVDPTFRHRMAWAVKQRFGVNHEK